MKPESLLGIALELIVKLAEPGRLPSDARVGRMFREKKFLGSRDRRFVGDAAYAWLRHVPRARARWASWTGAGLPLPPSPPLRAAAERGTLLADLFVIAADGIFPWSLAETVEAAKGLREPALAPEVIALDWSSVEWPRDPVMRRAAEWSLPAWLADRLAGDRGEDDARALALALLQQAPLDFRVNLSTSTRQDAAAWLESEIHEAAQPTPWSTSGLRLLRRAQVRGAITASEGRLEVEDEGSQVVVLSLGVEPGMTVIDACAGAGGKTLGIADFLFRPRDRAAVQSTGPGRIFACDTATERMDELRRRAGNARVDSRIEVIPISPKGPLPAALTPADLVLVDAPCSGLGTLRRNPELKLRFGPDDVRSFAVLQREILDRFAPLVKPGGRLAYATCSILAEENEDVARAFGAAHPDFVGWSAPWARSVLPASCIHDCFVTLDPVRSGTDGFFLATWTRKI